VQHDLSILAVYRDRLAVNLPHQKHWRPWPISGREQNLVVAHRSLNRLSDIALDPKKSIGRHHVVDALIGPEVIVVINKVRHARARIIEIRRRSSLPELILHGFPKALALAHRLRMMASCHRVMDAVLL
jgi:hypothetical protein